MLIERNDKPIKLKDRFVVPATITPLNLKVFENTFRDQTSRKVFQGSNYNDSIEVLGVGFLVHAIPNLRELYSAMGAVSVTLTCDVTSANLEQVYVPVESEIKNHMKKGIILDKRIYTDNLENGWLPTNIFSNGGQKESGWVKLDQSNIEVIVLNGKLESKEFFEVELRYRKDIVLKCRAL